MTRGLFLLCLLQAAFGEVRIWGQTRQHLGLRGGVANVLPYKAHRAGEPLLPGERGTARNILNLKKHARDESPSGEISPRPALFPSPKSALPSSLDPPPLSRPQLPTSHQTECARARH